MIGLYDSKTFFYHTRNLQYYNEMSKTDGLVAFLFLTQNEQVD